MVEVALALGVVLAATSAHAWAPERFDVYCGDAAFEVERDPDHATAAWYAAQTGDPDVPGDPACATSPQVAWFESALPEALQRLSIEPFPGSPAPGRLGPVRPGASGSPGVRFFVGDMDRGIAGVLRCLRPAADQLGILTVGAGTIDRLSRLSVPYVALHELVHVVQGAQPLERTACAGGARLPLWVSEGTADAFATLWIRETFPAFAPAPFASLGRNLLGLRPFTASLTAPDREPSMTGNFSYRASSLFRFVAEARHATAHDLAGAAMRAAAQRVDPSERVDRWLLHPALGPIALIAGLALTFHLTFAISDPWIGWFGLLQEVAAGWVAALALPPLLDSFLTGALIEGVGTVVAFVPVLFTLYVILGFLENAGILARVAFLADGLMRAIGLPGRAVLPMVLSIGCTVPAIQATRTLEDRGDRLRVALAIPSISCSARLPVFVLLAAAFVPAYAAVVVTGLYLLGFAVAIASALLFRRVLRTTEGSGAMELPSYRWPPASLVLRLAWARTRAFLQSAGGPILIVVAAIWALLEIELAGGVSLFEATARALAPVFAPLGLGDWRVVGALIPGAVAKEVVIGSLALTLVGAAEAVEPLGFLAGLGMLGAGLLEAARDTLTALWGLGGGGDAVDGLLGERLGGVLTTGAALALMVFTLLYVPCVATLAALRKAFGRRWMLFSIGYQVTVAYLAAWAVFALWP